MRNRITALLSVAFLLSAPAFAQGSNPGGKKYDPGVSDSEIKIGQSVPYSGPASAFGVWGRVWQAWVRMVNESGGINGRKIALTSLDNGFNPPKALEASRQLVESIGVFAEVGTLGTPLELR